MTMLINFEKDVIKHKCDCGFSFDICIECGEELSQYNNQYSNNNETSPYYNWTGLIDYERGCRGCGWIKWHKVTQWEGTPRELIEHIRLKGHSVLDIPCPPDRDEEEWDYELEKTPLLTGVEYRRAMVIGNKL